MKTRPSQIALFFAIALGAAGSPARAGETPLPLSPESAIIEEPESGWTAELGLTLWTVNMNGAVGAGGLVAPVDVSFGDILDNLDMALMGTLDLRKRGGRIGFLFEGSYIKLGPDIADSPLPFFTVDSLKIEQVMAAAAVYYRLAEWERGYLDVFAGARYMDLSNELNLTPDSAAISATSNSISSSVAGQISAKAAAAVARAKPILVDRLQSEARRLVIQGIKDGTIDPGKINPATVALVRAIAREQAAAIGSAARKRASKAVKKAERRLAKQIESQITNAIPASVGGSADWVDPFIGARAQHYLTDRVYLAALADIGGFGVGSDLSWQAGGGVGIDVFENFALEFFYRYMSIDYADDIIFDVDMSGMFLGAKTQTLNRRGRRVPARGCWHRAVRSAEKTQPTEQMKRKYPVLILFTLGMAAVASAQEGETADLAQKSQNPVGDLISLPLQNNFLFSEDGGDLTWNLNIQPVVPISLNEDWNLITRTILPVNVMGEARARL